MLVRRAAGFPKPEPVSLNHAGRVGRYLADLVEKGVSPCVNTSPSNAIRIAQAMLERGESLRAVTFLLGGEPLTQKRRTFIEGAGADAVPTYGFSEGGPVGSQCPNPRAADDIHVYMDAFAVIQRDGALPDGLRTKPILLTSLRPACPKIFLNTEIGDSAVIEYRRCDCLFDELGYHQHLYQIRSTAKLSFAGMTVLCTDLFRLMEETLPSRFGGTAIDYQLLEKQDTLGFPCYVLRVSPEVGPLDERALLSFFLEESGKIRHHYRFTADLWSQA